MGTQTFNLGRVQGASVFTADMPANTQISTSQLKPNNLTPFIGDHIIFQLGEVYEITAINSNTITCKKSVVIRSSTPIINRLDSSDIDKALSANMGRELNDNITNIINNTTLIHNQDNGFAGGTNAHASNGGAVGYAAGCWGGGAIGNSSSATNGFSGGLNAKSTVDSIQLGTGQNEVAKTLKVYNYTVMNADGTLNDNGTKLINKYVTLETEQTISAKKTYTASAIFKQPIQAYEYNTSQDAPAIIMDKPNTGSAGIGAHGDMTIQFGSVDNMNSTTWNNSDNLHWNFRGDINTTKSYRMNKKALMQYNSTDDCIEFIFV